MEGVKGLRLSLEPFRMRTFTVFIEDSRYSVPTLKVVVAADEERARELAMRELDASRNHLSVEVQESGCPLFRQERV
jgi:hypothetical protein